MSKFTRNSISRERLELYLKDGLTDLAISKLMGCGEATIMLRRQDFGLPSAHPKAPIEIDRDRLAEMVAAGKSDRTIADELGCAESVIQKRRAQWSLGSAHPNRGGASKAWPCDLIDADFDARDRTPSDAAFARLLRGGGYTDDPRIKPVLNSRIDGTKPPRQFSYHGSAAAMCVA